MLCYYLIQLLLASIVGIMVYTFINKSIGHSTSLDILSVGFDRTVLMDMIRVYRMEFKAVRFWTIGILLLYFGIGIFLNAGILAGIVLHKNTLKTFFSRAAHYAVPFSILALWFHLLWLTATAIVYFGFNNIIGDPLKTFSSEKPYVLWIIGLVILCIFVLIFLWIWSILTRIHYIKYGHLRSSIAKGWSDSLAHFKSYYLWGIILCFLHIALMIIYLLTNKDLGASSLIIVIAHIILQQFFSMVRIILNVGGMAGLYHIHLQSNPSLQNS